MGAATRAATRAATKAPALRSSQASQTEKFEKVRRKAEERHVRYPGREERSLEREVQVLRVERGLLRRQVWELQRENTALTMGIGRTEGGKKMLSELRVGRAESLGLATPGPVSVGKENLKV